jgi:hypothetical protein
MLGNYLLVAWRQLQRRRLYSLINIAGLAVGMSVAMLIGIWIWDELTFNHWHSRHASLVRILSIERLNNEVTVDAMASVPMEAALRSHHPSAFRELALVNPGGHVLATKDKKVSQWGMWAQSAFPVMFSFRMVSGDATALKDPSSMLLSQSAAQALFGSTGALNRTVTVDGRTQMKVAGVFADPPENSQFHGTGVLMAWDNKDNRGTTMGDDWYDHHFQLYAELADGVTAADVTARIKDLSKPHLKGGFEELALQPMDQWHLYNEFSNGKQAGGEIRTVRLFMAIGFFILLLACINFMNLSTAQGNKRAKEVGLRKTVGSGRGQLIAQFLGESLIMTCFSLTIAVGLAALVMPMFDRLAGKQLVFPWTSPGFWLAAACFTILTGLLAGSYPAFYLSGFKPADVLKGVFRAGRSPVIARKVLVVVQFTISIALIIGILVVNRQIRYAQDRPVGYTRAGLITVGMNEPGLMGHFDALRTALIRSGGVSEVAASSSPATDVENDMLGYNWKGRDPNATPAIGTLFVSYEFGRTVGWRLKEGRDFSRDFPTDSGAFIINEAAARYMGISHPVGEFIRWHNEDHPIIGVIRDMVMESPYRPVEPTFFTLRTDRRIHVITLRLHPNLSQRAALALIEPVFREYSPGSPFVYSFTDEDYAVKFRAEEQIGALSGMFTLLALFISCLGLFGLASFVAEQRTREIGIRKVLGASVLQLWGLLSREFVLLVLFAFLFVSRLSDEWALPEFSRRTLIYGALMVASRYDGAILVAGAGLLLLWRRKWLTAAELALWCLLPAIVFGIISMFKGSYFLPNVFMVEPPAGSLLSYDWLAGCAAAVAVPLLSGYLNKRLDRKIGWTAGGAIFILALTLTARNLYAFRASERNSLGTYRTNYPIAQFAHRYYYRYGIVSDDVGMISFHADGRYLDLSGLASIRIARSRVDHFLSPGLIHQLSIEQNARVAIISDRYDRPLPDHWIHTGEWVISGQDPTEKRTVSFYAIDSSAATQLRKNLEEYTHFLPQDLTVQYFYSPPPEKKDP